MKSKILLIEGKRADRPSFVAGLTRKGYQVESVPNGSAALTRLEQGALDLLVVDAASMRTSGKRICQSLHEHTSAPLILVVEAAQIESVEKENVADIVLAVPFTLQKLVNRIRTLLPQESKDVITTGPIQLDPTQHWVRVGKRHTSLTPRLSLLLRILMEHPGEVVEREALFRQVWETAYTEDTRTLDVHVSWLRRAVEADARKPKYIVTIRGVGYRLDLDEKES
jgi:DNA-binding response OmpR family regulator